MFGRRDLPNRARLKKRTASYRRVRERLCGEYERESAVAISHE